MEEFTVNMENTNKGLPVVTVVVPAYNHENYIGDCIDSILGQDWPAIELFVINDGSTDKTHEKVLQAMEKYPGRIKYTNKENEGLVTSLNIAIFNGTGKYFCQLASDDKWTDGSLRARVEFLENNPYYEVVFGDAVYIRDGVLTEERFLGDKKTGYDSKVNTVTDLVTRKAKILFPSGLMRRDTLVRLNGFDKEFRNFEDVSMRYRLAQNATIGYLNEPVMNYRVHSSNTNASPKYLLSAREEKILSYEKLFDSSDDENLKDILKGKLFKKYMYYVKVGIKMGGDKAKLTEAVNKAIEIKPWSLKARYYKVKI